MSSEQSNYLPLLIAPCSLLFARRFLLYILIDFPVPFLEEPERRNQHGRRERNRASDKNPFQKLPHPFPPSFSYCRFLRPVQSGNAGACDPLHRAVF